VLIADQWWHFEMDGLDLRIALDEAVACRLWYSGRGHKVKGLLPGDLQALVAVLCRQKRGGANSAKIKPRERDHLVVAVRMSNMRPASCHGKARHGRCAALLDSLA
jgi:hypothetical protein